tara:strand:+ start:1252 stop:2388 length:1137 start_codon:yes stop_codon:yes gene_type:complete
MKEYLDFNATTSVSKETAGIMHKFLVDDFGNAGSRTHESGSKAKKAVLEARQEISNIFDADFSELIFTSGATESNNIAILGLREFAKNNNKNHIISTQIEHKAVLDPLHIMESEGFDVTYIKPNKNGVIEEKEVIDAIRKDTFLISIMHANNETGSINPINSIFKKAKKKNSGLFCHSDAAQTFAKTALDFTSKDIDMFSISAHKFHGPKGIGALLTRKSDGISLPLKPLMFGGGQEKGLRPGTLPVHLIAGMGHASLSSHKNAKQWHKECSRIKIAALKAFVNIDHMIYGDLENTLPNTLSISFADIHAEALIICLKDVAEISTGSACTSASYSPSHVLTAMGLDKNNATKVVRFSWGSNTNSNIWNKIAERIEILL